MAKKLGFGTMRLPLLDEQDQASIDIEQYCRMADLFVERGFTYFDTAWMYHNHNAEDAFRKAVSERLPRDKYTIADKMPTMMLYGPKAQEEIFEAQLKKLGVDVFDYYLIHNLNVDNYAECLKYGTIEYVEEQKARGRIKHLGFSFHDNADFLEMLLKKYPEMEFVQLQLNYLDWDNDAIQSRRCYETARKYNKEIVVMEPVKGGVLAKLPPVAEKILRDIHPDWSPAEWAIKFAASLPGVRLVLSGMTSIEQLDENTAFLQDFVPLTDEEVQAVFKVRDIIMNDGSIPCTRCRYCVEANTCPMGIPIPDYFTLYNIDLLDVQNAATGWTPQEQYYGNMVGHGAGRASGCIGCRGCESVCPQHIKITEWMEKVSKRFDSVT
ncbi:MAG: aldo/keto reductase [Clostridia bacterium]|nr:aldo/keto reductase [Clostridia bacterium]